MRDESTTWSRTIAVAAGVIAIGILPAAATASAPVAALQDLVGAKGSSGETALTHRGYALVGVTSPTSPVYWREPGTGRCVGVRTADGRVRAVDYVAEATCERAAAYRPSSPPPGKTGFFTVCGTTVDGKTYRYKCTVEGVAVGRPGRTVLHFPDNRVDLQWLGGDRVRATFAGMVPRETTFATTDGTTRFDAWDKPYFFVSDRTRAAAEVKAFRPE
jgi:hypothetical protein